MTSPRNNWESWSCGNKWSSQDALFMLGQPITIPRCPLKINAEGRFPNDTLVPLSVVSGKMGVPHTTFLLANTKAFIPYKDHWYRRPLSFLLYRNTRAVFTPADTGVFCTVRQSSVFSFHWSRGTFYSHWTTLGHRNFHPPNTVCQGIVSLLPLTTAWTSNSIMHSKLAIYLKKFGNPCSKLMQAANGFWSTVFLGSCQSIILHKFTACLTLFRPANTRQQISVLQSKRAQMGKDFVILSLERASKLSKRKII